MVQYVDGIIDLLGVLAIRVVEMLICEQINEPRVEVQGTGTLWNCTFDRTRHHEFRGLRGHKERCSVYVVVAVVERLTVPYAKPNAMWHVITLTSDLNIENFSLPQQLRFFEIFPQHEVNVDFRRYIRGTRHAGYFNKSSTTALVEYTKIVQVVQFHL